jgi:uncharacterized protein YwqG
MTWAAHGLLLILKGAGVLVLAIVIPISSLVVYIAVLWAMLWVKELIFGKRPDPSGSDGRRLRGLMKRLARPTLLLAPAKTTVFSKLGGAPELPEGIAWPEGEKAPRAFLAQIDLGEVKAADGPDWLPPEGRLYAFHDEWRAGFADEVRILSSQAPPGPAAPPPSTLAARWRFQERGAVFLPFISIPSLDWLGVDVADLDVSEAELDELADAPNEPFGDELQHRIGGYPSEIQDGRMRLECEYLARGLEPEGEPPPNILRASREWRLLLQIDSDPALGMNWGDGGRLYVFVRQKHALAGDFSKTVTLSQSY